MSWLYRYECKGLQAWIVAGGKLREMVAASAMIDQLGELRRALSRSLGHIEAPTGSQVDAQHPVQVIAEAAGGATLQFFDHATLQAFVRHWPMVVEGYVPGLHLIHAWTEDTGDALERLRLALGPARNVLHPHLPAAGPLAARTNRTGLAAVGRSGQDRRLVDAASAAKARHYIAAHLTDDTVLSTLDARFGLLPAEAPARTEEDFGEGPVALIHADGNGIGRWLSERRVPLARDEFQRFSKHLAEATAGAAREATASIRALVAMRHDARDRLKLPMRPLVLGGDDVTLVIGARLALPWTVAFLRAFMRLSTELGARVDHPQEGFSACAGIVYCKRNWPMAQAHHLADDLCRHAKQALRGEAGAGESGLLFARVLGATAPDYATIRATALGSGRLAGGPYRVGRTPGHGWSHGCPAIEDLARIAEALDDLPKGAVRGLIDAVGTGDEDRSAKGWQRVKEVLGDKPAQQRRVRTDLEAAGLDWATARWQGAADRSPLLDAVIWNRIHLGTKMDLGDSAWDAAGEAA